ncbi:MAG: MATE family efflux transporter [Nanobdellota archaeon]
MNKHQKDLAYESIPKLLFKQAGPAMIGLLLMSLYNLVDTIFIGNGVGPLGIAGIAVAFPIQMISMAIGQTVGIGSASIISRRFGAGKYEEAQKALGNFFTSITLIAVVITGLALIFLVPLLSLFGATPEIMPFAKEYLEVIVIGTVFAMFAGASNAIIRSEGNAKFSMFIMIFAALVNIALDAVFIFGFGLGMSGAALATVISQGLASVIALWYFLAGRGALKFKGFSFNLSLLREKFSIGASSLARQAASSVMIITVNNSLAYYGGSMAISSIGIIMRILMFIIMPVIGLLQGLQPIVGYNYGAENYERTKRSIKLSMLVATALTTAAFLIIEFFTKPILGIFTSDPGLIDKTIPAMRLVVMMFPLVGFQIIAGGMYQSLGKARKAFILSIMRQILFLTPLVLILPLFFRIDGVWAAYPLADLFAGIIVAFILRHEFRLLTPSSRGKAAA